MSFFLRLETKLVRMLAGACVLALALLMPGAALAQQQGSISGKIVDPDGLALPGATVTLKNQGTGYIRWTTTATNGSYTFPSLDPGSYGLTVTMPGFSDTVRKDLAITAGFAMTLELKMKLGGMAEELTVVGGAPLVETTSNKIGGTLSGSEIEDVPSNFRNFTALTQLIPGMTPSPGLSSFEGGQVVANGTPSVSNIYLLDGAYNNDDRLGGSQGTQVRVVLDNIGEYQVLANQYSAEYGGGAGAIINMVTRGGSNQLSGRVYTYFRDDKFNTLNHFVKAAGGRKQSERTLQMGAGVGGAIVKSRAHYYLTVEKDNEDAVGFKTFPAAAGPMGPDSINGKFQVRALNVFGRVDVQLNSSNFLSIRAIREKAPTKGENFNTGTQTIDQQQWESDLDEVGGLSYTRIINDRASNVLRMGMIREQLDTGRQAYFEESSSFLIGNQSMRALGFGGRDPFSIGQQNTHPGWTTGKGGPGAQTSIHSYTIDNSFTYFVPSLAGGEHTFKFGAGASWNRSDPQVAQDSGVFTFTSDLPFNPANPVTFPTRFDIQLVPTGSNGASVDALDRRIYGFVEDKWRATKKLTLNLGLRYDTQQITPGDKHNFAPRVGFALDVAGDGKTIIRGGGGRFFAMNTVAFQLLKVRNGVQTLFPTLSVGPTQDTCNCILRPDLIQSVEGTHGVAQLSAAGQADLAARRAAILSGALFNANPNIDDPNRKMPYQWSFSFGVSREVTKNSAVTLDYVGNVSRDQIGPVDINESAPNALGVVTRLGVNTFDPGSAIMTGLQRNTTYGRVLQYQTRKELDGSYNSMQFSFIKRASNHWSGRLAYTLQKSNYVGLGNPEARALTNDADPAADAGRFAVDRRHVIAATATVTPWKTLSISAILSKISGAPINETVGRDINGDGVNNDRPIEDISNFNTVAGVRVFYPILSAKDSTGRAVINGIQGPGSVQVDMSFRYQIHLDPAGRRSLDLFFDIFNVSNQKNIVAPLGNHASALFMKETSSLFARQMQLGARIRF